ncbi:MAG: rRNA cytosine-C5-methyltransferase [Saprospiraceae bacterium]|nr:MAG: rRNA cytosine-C5-methyltransferase [Saprospiraceae bacterium]
MQLPVAFAQQMRLQLGTDFDAFVAALLDAPPVSIHYHPQKQKNRKENIGGVKWNSDGVYLSERPVFTLDPAFQAGAYYVQEASSMFVKEAFRQSFPEAGTMNVLDLCAAPGGKSTLLASTIPEGSVLLSNEVIRNRYRTLRYNMVKWGQGNTHLSQHDSREFQDLSGFFDLVLVDAPCSGEGLFRKDPKAQGEWSPEHVQHCSARQRRILSEAVQLVKPGGFLFYCTCTYNDVENQANAQWMEKEFDLTYFPLKHPEEWNLVEKDRGLQLYPHRVKGEGFYLVCFRKNGIAPKLKIPGQPALSPLPRKQKEQLNPWIKEMDTLEFGLDKQGNIRAWLKEQQSAISQLAGTLRRFQAGFEVGTFKGKDFIPAPELALHTSLNKSIPSVEVDRMTALKFLKKEALELPGLPKGWTLIKYEGLGLGWVKVLPNRINNYYPKGWRILMEIT